jgi:hypothetical protein
MEDDLSAEVEAPHGNWLALDRIDVFSLMCWRHTQSYEIPTPKAPLQQRILKPSTSHLVVFLPSMFYVQPFGISSSLHTVSP